MLARIIQLAVNAYIFIILARAVLSWVNPDPRHPAARFLDRLTEPVLRPIRERLNMNGPVDFSPMVAVLILLVLQQILLSFIPD